ncbi:MAG: type IV toxin-antitoxin system AbiEi family antitoxin [Pseudomonadota bacterium]|nr:type IV toxin-antitoxin system AbiEi family antitoxin [Pseudomonadota bacterium]
MERQKISPTISNPESRKRHAAYQFVRHRQARGTIAFTMDELRKTTGLSPEAALGQLSRLSGQVVRVGAKSGFYLIVRPDQALIGAPPAEWWLHSYFKHLGRPYYIGLLSAAAEYGSSHQAIQFVQVVTDRPMRAIQVGRISMRFFVRKDIEQVAVRLKTGAYARLLLSTAEATALDLVRYSSRIGGMARAAQAIKGMMQQLTEEGFALALNTGVEQPVLQRLGYILQQFQGDALVRPIASKLREGRKRQIYLEAGPGNIVEERFRESAQWGIIENIDLQQLS